MSATSILDTLIYEALAAQVANASIWQDVPPDTPAPFVVVGDMKSVPGPCKDDPDRRITVSIVSVVSAEERKPLLAIMADVETALDGCQFSQDGWMFEGSLQSDDAALAEDGVSYVGTSEFLFLAFKV